MSRRQVSARIEACAREAEAAHLALQRVEQDLRLLARSWDSTQPLEMLNILRETLDSIPPTSINNSLEELAYLRAAGNRIRNERERARRRRGSKVLPDDEPALHPVPPAQPLHLEDLDLEYETFNRGTEPPKPGEDIL